MDYSNIIDSLFTLVIIPLIIAGIAWGKKRNKDEVFQKYAGILGDAVISTVGSLKQVVVDDLKKSGEWTDERKAEVLKTAKNEVLLIIGPAAIGALSEIVGDLDQYITNKIETAVGKSKAVG